MRNITFDDMHGIRHVIAHKDYVSGKAYKRGACAVVSSTGAKQGELTAVVFANLAAIFEVKSTAAITADSYVYIDGNDVISTDNTGAYLGLLTEAVPANAVTRAEVIVGYPR